MKRSTLWLLWGVFYIICAGLGFIPEPSGMVRAMLFLLALLFFVPPAVLLHEARRAADRETLRRLRRIAAASLGLTLALLIGNILAALGGTALDTPLHIALGLVSAPMFCSNYWVVSLFLWAVLLMASFVKKK